MCLQCWSGKGCLVMGGFGGLMGVGLEGSDSVSSRGDFSLRSMSHGMVYSVPSDLIRVITALSG